MCIRDRFNLSERKTPEIISFIGNNPHIFILDGTWFCARKMLKLSKNLQELKRVSFDNKIKSKFIVKQQPQSLCLSTIESIYTVLNLFKEADLEKCETKDFLVPFEKMNEHQVECFLNQNCESNHSSGKEEIKPRDVYQRNTKRSIIFEKDR